MAIDPTRLYTALLNTGLQQKDNPLYQVIHDLINNLSAISKQTNLSSSISSNTNTIQNNITQLLTTLSEDGIDGLDGVPGLSGVQGIQGISGINGSNGFSGIDGIDGDNGISIPGIQGLGGIPGIQGMNGTFGLDGVDGEDSLSFFRVISASELMNGTLIDARLSANVPLLNAANLFTNNQTITKITEQFRLRYDASNYNALTVNSIGSLAILAVGTTPIISMTANGGMNFFGTAVAFGVNFKNTTAGGAGQGDVNLYLDKAPDGNSNSFTFRTGGADRWQFGTGIAANDDNFRIRQGVNAATVLTAELTGAVDNTLYLKAGKVGINTNNPVSTLTVQGLVNLFNYTVATLPTGTRGDICYCTDLLAPGFLVAAVGGGTVVGPVFRNATTWVAI